ncbi:MAG: hypothetical protein KDA58_07010 [Planctomycetaceae bacterium]|nr:hypothetical protein [Planctomycetaceae bacterium]
MHIRHYALTALLSTALLNSAMAQGFPAPSSTPRLIAPPNAGAYVQPVNGVSYSPGYGVPSQGQYPQLNASLYPAPVQNVPAYTGSTFITNQAFAPHEMLYEHDYHAMYGPFFYKVTGGWIWTPLGMRQHENWQLQGTEVKVKYRSKIPLLSGYH